MNIGYYSNWQSGALFQMSRLWNRPVLQPGRAEITKQTAMLAKSNKQIQIIINTQHTYNYFFSILLLLSSLGI